MDRVAPEISHKLLEKLPNTDRLPMQIALDVKHATARAALDHSHTRFFNGRLCSRGHLSDRYATTGNCVECLAERSRTHRISEEKVDVPPCIVGRPDQRHCLSCEQREVCGGRFANTALIRATFAFPDHEPLRRIDASRAGAAIHRPLDPCPSCGRHSWRDNRDGKCGECEADRLPVRNKPTPEESAEKIRRIHAQRDEHNRSEK